MHKLNQVCKENVKIALKTSKIKAASTYSYESKRKINFYTVTNQLCKMLNLFFVFFLRVEIVYIRKMATSLVIDLLAKTKRAARVLFCF